MHQITSGALVETQSLYVGIYDAGAAANVPGFMDDAWAAGQRQVEQEGLEELFTLFTFNERLLLGAREGEILSWTLLFDGVFRAVAEVLPGSCPQRAQQAVDLGSDHLEADLQCQTGRLMISCLSRMGQGGAPFIEVEPGNYRVKVKRNREEEFNHGLLASESQYPDAEGPDWKITVQRIVA